MKASSGVTLKEAIVTLVVVVGLFLVVWTVFLRMPGESQMAPLAQMKQLHLVTQQMALDRVATGDTNLGWPGDAGGSFAEWSDAVVPEYLGRNDFAKLLSLRGKMVVPGVVPRGNTNAILLYAVGSNSPDRAVMLSTANFTNTATGGVAPKADAVPYGDKGFVVFRKGGDGAVLMGRMAGDTNRVGVFAPLCE